MPEEENDTSLALSSVLEAPRDGGTPGVDDETMPPVESVPLSLPIAVITYHDEEGRPRSPSLKSLFDEALIEEMEESAYNFSSRPSEEEAPSCWTWRQDESYGDQSSFSPYPNNNTIHFDSLNLLQQLQALEESMRLTQDDKRKGQLLLSKLKSILKTEFGKCKILPFGSFATNLPSSGEVDVFVKFPKPSLKMGHKKLLKTVASSLAPHFTMTHTLLFAIHLTDQEIGVEAYLKVTKEVALRSTELLITYMEYEPLVRSLMTLVRYFWVNSPHSRMQKGIGNYALDLLVLTYCGRMGLIPSVLQMQKAMEDLRKSRKQFVHIPHPSHLENVTTEGFDTTFIRDSILLKDCFAGACTEGLPSLLVGFFKFCCDLDFGSVVIAPNGFDILPRHWFGRMTQRQQRRSDSVAAYCNWLWSSRGRELVTTSPLCIQDVFALNENVTLNCTNESLIRFIAFCSEKVQLLTDIINGGTNSILSEPQPNDDPFNEIPSIDGIRKIMLMTERHARLVVQDVQEALAIPASDANHPIGLRFVQRGYFFKQFAASVRQLDNLKHPLRKCHRLWESIVQEYAQGLFRTLMKLEVQEKYEPINTERKRSNDQFPEVIFSDRKSGRKSGKKRCPEIQEGKENAAWKKLKELEHGEDAGVSYFRYSAPAHDPSAASNRTSRLLQQVMTKVMKDKNSSSKRKLFGVKKVDALLQELANCTFDFKLGVKDGLSFASFVFHQNDGSNLKETSAARDAIEALATVVANTLPEYVNYKLAECLELTRLPKLKYLGPAFCSGS